MDLETAPSRSAQPRRRKGILRGALLRRSADLRKSWRHLVSAECLEFLGPLASDVAAFLSEPEPGRTSALPADSTWLNCEKDFWCCLSDIALAREIKRSPADERPARLLIGDLKKLSSEDRFDLLCTRYRCPLNIAAESELEVAEELLRQLMVQDRVRLEAGEEYDIDMVLLKLNLIGIHAILTRDLRYLDALNYFYELPRRSLTRMRTNPRLLAFWLCIYTQLLTPEW